jgi:hypothetical protein
LETEVDGCGEQEGAVGENWVRESDLGRFGPGLIGFITPKVHVLRMHSLCLNVEIAFTDVVIRALRSRWEYYRHNQMRPGFGNAWLLNDFWESVTNCLRKLGVCIALNCRTYLY